MCVCVFTMLTSAVGVPALLHTETEMLVRTSTAVFPILLSEHSSILLHSLLSPSFSPTHVRAALTAVETNTDLWGNTLTQLKHSLSWLSSGALVNLPSRVGNWFLHFSTRPVKWAASAFWIIFFVIHWPKHFILTPQKYLWIVCRCWWGWGVHYGYLKCLNVLKGTKNFFFFLAFLIQLQLYHGNQQQITETIEKYYEPWLEQNAKTELTSWKPHFQTKKTRLGHFVFVLLQFPKAGIWFIQNICNN